MIKTYKCPVHGEFDHECNIGDPELRICGTHGLYARNKVERKLNSDIEPFYCDEPVTRVFKPVGYSWKTNGFAGRGFDIAK